MAEIVTISGAKAVINVAPFKTAMALKNAITSELAKSGIDLQVLIEKQNQKESDVKVDLKSIISAVLAVDSSPVVYAAIFECLARCSYNDEKITEKTFEADAARGDYYQIVLECVQANLLPFFMALASRLSGLKSLLNSRFQQPK